MDDLPLSAEKLDTLEERLRTELNEIGGLAKYRVAWGRK